MSLVAAAGPRARDYIHRAVCGSGFTWRLRLPMEAGCMNGDSYAGVNVNYKPHCCIKWAGCRAAAGVHESEESTCSVTSSVL